MRSGGAERRDFFTASRDGRPAGLSVEPDVFHAPAVEDAVGRDRQPFDIGLPTGCTAPVEDDRPGGAPRARDITEAQAETILNKVLDAGINYIDTSIDYGLSEERIGRYISHRCAEYYLASKCGCLAYSILTISGVLVSCTTRRRWQLRRNRDRRNPDDGYK